MNRTQGVNTMVSPVTYKELKAVSKDPSFARRKVVEVYKRTGSIRETARIFSMSRNTARAIIREYEEKGEEAFLPSPRPPRRSPRRTPEPVEAKVLEYKASHPSWGVKRIAEQLARKKGVRISPTTVWRILKRSGVETSSRKRKKNSGGAAPTVWVWEKYEDREGVILLQVDWKYILDKKALGTLRYDHIRKRGLPRYQLTLLEARSRLRLLFYAYRLETYVRNCVKPPFHRRAGNGGRRSGGGVPGQPGHLVLRGNSSGPGD